MNMKFGLWTFHKLQKRQKNFDFIDFWLPLLALVLCCEVLAALQVSVTFFLFKIIWFVSCTVGAETIAKLLSKRTISDLLRRQLPFQRLALHCRVVYQALIRCLHLMLRYRRTSSNAVNVKTSSNFSYIKEIICHFSFSQCVKCCLFMSFSPLYTECCLKMSGLIDMPPKGENLRSSRGIWRWSLDSWQLLIYLPQHSSSSSSSPNLVEAFAANRTSSSSALFETKRLDWNAFVRFFTYEQGSWVS